MKASLRIFGILGFLIFAYGFSLTFYLPGYVEDIGKDFIKDRITASTNKKVDELQDLGGDSAIGKIAQKYLEKNKEKLDGYKRLLKQEAHKKIANVIAEMRDLDCECRKKYEVIIANSLIINIAKLEEANQKLADYMKSKYMEVANKLKRDFRIFTGVNAVVFLFLLGLSFLKERAIVHLFLPGMLMVVSTAICSYFYLFEQNWFFTIIYDSYTGWAYLGYFFLVFVLLCDIAFNKARVTTEIINAFLSAIGSALSVVSC